VYNGVKSDSFLKSDWQIITLERLFHHFFGESLYKAIYKITNHENRLQYLVNQVERMTGLKDFGEYLNKLFTVDAFFLNEDRHMHNIAVLMNGKSAFSYCPILDNGAGLLSDTNMDYPVSEDVYELMQQSRAKTICSDYDEQLDLSEKLYGNQMKFLFSKEDVTELLQSVTAYTEEEKRRVETIIYSQMRKYQYLWK
jgi:hypothetical protein